MSKNPSTIPATTSSNLNDPTYFGSPPLMEGEDFSDYERFLNQVIATVKPQDIFERMWVRDIVDCEWVVLRYRRLHADLISGTMGRGLHVVLKNLMEMKNPLSLKSDISAWEKREPKALEKIERKLASVNLTMGNVESEAVALRLQQIETIERLAANAKSQCNNAIHELERHRSGFGKSLRRAFNEIEDAEFAEMNEGAEEVEKVA